MEVPFRIPYHYLLGKFDNFCYVNICVELSILMNSDEGRTGKGQNRDSGKDDRRFTGFRENFDFVGFVQSRS